jgi:hypothetical protein
MDWPEAIWEMWTLFESHYGSVEQVNTAFNQISTLSEDVTRIRLEVSLVCHTHHVASFGAEHTLQSARAATSEISNQLPTQEFTASKRKVDDILSVESIDSSKRVKRDDVHTVLEKEPGSSLAR